MVDKIVKNNNEPRSETKRFLTSVQSRGGLGKSTLASLLIEWYQYAGISFKALDSDTEHQSLKNRYPDHTSKFDATKNQDAFGVMLDRLPDSPVVLLDCRANFTTDFLEYSTHYRLIEVFERKGFRATIFIFMSNDEDSRRSAADLVTYFGEAADYVMVDNPKNFHSDEFKRTGLFKFLTERGSPMVIMPEISKVSKYCWEDLEEKSGGHLSISKVISHEACTPVTYFELSGVKDLMFRQLEDIAKLIVPDVSLIKQKVNRIAESKPVQRSSRFKDPLFAKS